MESGTEEILIFPLDFVPAGRIITNMNEEIENWILDMAWAQGAAFPEIAYTADGTQIVVIDTDSGRTWKVDLKEF